MTKKKKQTSHRLGRFPLLIFSVCEWCVYILPTYYIVAFSPLRLVRLYLFPLLFPLVSLKSFPPLTTSSGSGCIYGGGSLREVATSHTTRGDALHWRLPLYSIPFLTRMLLLLLYIYFIHPRLHPTRKAPSSMLRWLQPFSLPFLHVYLLSYAFSETPNGRVSIAMSCDQAKRMNDFFFPLTICYISLCPPLVRT